MTTIECPHCGEIITLGIKIYDKPKRDYVKKPLNIDDEVKKIKYYAELTELDKIKKEIMAELASAKNESRKSKLRLQLLDIRKRIQAIKKE